MRKIWLTFLLFFSLCTITLAQSELVPVLDGIPQIPVYEQEEITLEDIKAHKYKLKKTVAVETYVQEKEKEVVPEIKKGRFSVRGGVAKKDDCDIYVGDKVLIKPEFSLTEEFALIMIDKRDPKDYEYSSQEFGVKYTPNWFKDSSFSILGSDKEGRQKFKFNTDFYLW